MAQQSAPAFDPAIEQIRALLRSTVQEALQTRPDGAHLTFVGGLFGKQVGAPFEQYVNYIVLQEKTNIPPAKRKMLPFLKEYCDDLFELSRLPEGSVIIRERSPAAVEDLTNQESDDVHKLVFQKSIWLAFVRPLPLDRRRFLNIGDRLGYTDFDLTTTAPEGWKELERKYILGIPYGSIIDGQAVREAIARWANDNEVQLAKLTVKDFEPPVHRPSLTELARIVDALPPELASRWLIPAEVLRHLRK